MKLYFDSSAIVKLVQGERESAALRRFLRRHQDDVQVTSALARVEVVRAVAAGGPAAVAHARRQLGRLHQIAVDITVLDTAALLAPDTLLRGLEALHLASASLLGADLRAVLTYEERIGSAAASMGLMVSAPA